MSPTPNTTFWRAAARFGHFTQTIARSRNRAIAASFAAGSSAGPTGGDSTSVVVDAGTKARGADDEGIFAATTAGVGATAALAIGAAIVPRAGAGALKPASTAGETATNRRPVACGSSRCAIAASRGAKVFAQFRAGVCSTRPTREVAQSCSAKDQAQRPHGPLR